MVDKKNTEWKKSKFIKKENFEGKNVKQKMENIKNIPLFENIYEKGVSDIRPPSDYREPIVEGYTDKQQCNVDIATEDRMQNVESSNSPHITKDTLYTGITNTLAQINQLNNPTGSFEESSVINNGMNSTSDSSASPKISINKSDLIAISNDIKAAILGFFNIIKTFFMSIFGILSLINQYLQYFILNYHIYYKQLMTNIANGLTGGHTTESELYILMNESQKFITVLFLWIFVYNWYYISFYVDVNKRWTFSANYLNKYHLVYMLFSPSVRAVENANYILVDKIPNLMKRMFSKKIIFILLISFFWVLISLNFQSSLIYDFFASLNNLKLFQSSTTKKIPSIITLYVLLTVLFYGIWHYATGSMTFYCLDLFRGGIFGIFVGAVLLIFTFGLYMAYLVLTNVPLGVVFMCTYFFGYTFFAIVGYEGFNCFTHITGISEEISMIDIQPSLTVYEDNYTYFSFFNIKSWFYTIPKRIYNFTKWLSSVIIKFIFEILIILNLLGGIYVYLSNYKSIITEKNKLYGIVNTSGVARAAFRNLFTWLILINILIIIMLGIAIQRKIKIIELNDSTNDNQVTKIDSQIQSGRGKINGGISVNGMNENGIYKNEINGINGMNVNGIKRGINENGINGMNVNGMNGSMGNDNYFIAGGGGSS